MAQEILNGSSGQTVLLMFFLKAVVVLIILWAGAYGGTLTPSFALGMAGAGLLCMILGLDSQSTILLFGIGLLFVCDLEGAHFCNRISYRFHWARYRFSSVSLSNGCFSL